MKRVLYTPLQLVFEEKKIFAKVINLYDFMSQKAALRLKDNCMRVYAQWGQNKFEVVF